MASNVEILFFGRPEGLEVSQSALLEGHKDSLYPEQGIAETTDGLVWRVQFFSSGNTPLQVISCFKAMGSPTRGAGGFIGVAVAMAGQFKLNEALAAHLQNELSRFVNAATNGVQFVSSRMEGWPVPQPYPHNLEPRSSLYLAVGGTPSFIGFNLDSGRMAEQIETSLGVNLPKGATTAHFMSSYSGDRRDAVDLNARVDSSSSNPSIPQSSGTLDLELEISDLKKSLKQAQSDLVQSKELLHAETQNKESIRRELDDALREVDKLRRANKPKDTPRPWIWTLLGIILGAAGLYFTVVSPIWKKKPAIVIETRLDPAGVEGETSKKKAFDPIESLRDGRALTPEQMRESGVFETVVRLEEADCPSEWKTPTLLDARYQSIVGLLQSSDAEFDKFKFCGTCLKYNVPFIQKSEYKLSVLEAFESDDPQVKKWLEEITFHATSNPLFQENEEWTIYLDNEMPLGNGSQSFEQTNPGGLCDEANLPGNLNDGPKTNLCWEINRIAFKTQLDEQKYFTKWRLTPRD